VGKKNSTVENRVYLFRELASSFLEHQGQAWLEGSEQRRKGLLALSDLAYVACILADTEALKAEEVAERVLSRAPEPKRPAEKSRGRSARSPKTATRAGVQKKPRPRKKVKGAR